MRKSKVRVVCTSRYICLCSYLFSHMFLMKAKSKAPRAWSSGTHRIILTQYMMMEEYVINFWVYTLKYLSMKYPYIDNPLLNDLAKVYIYIYIYIHTQWGSLMTQTVKNTPANAGDIRDTGLIPGSGRSLEKEMATQSSILAWRILRIEESGGL